MRNNNELYLNTRICATHLSFYYTYKLCKIVPCCKETWLHSATMLPGHVTFFRCSAPFLFHRNSYASHDLSEISSLRTMLPGHITFVRCSAPFLFHRNSYAPHDLSEISSLRTQSLTIYGQTILVSDTAGTLHGSGSCCNIRQPSENHYALTSRDTSFAHDLLIIC